MQLIGITTPMEEGCDYSMMMDLKHENGNYQKKKRPSFPTFFFCCFICTYR